MKLFKAVSVFAFSAAMVGSAPAQVQTPTPTTPEPAMKQAPAAQPNGASSNALGTGAADGVSGQSNGAVPQVPAGDAGRGLPAGNKPAQ